VLVLYKSNYIIIDLCDFCVFLMGFGLLKRQM